ncbi:sensor histidine kinase [Clostridium sp.]|uniref:sensor histidine kinase n=1 Tax=Clostridium sp. TaxID=1506 RepID=UPI003F3744AF
MSILEYLKGKMPLIIINIVAFILIAVIMIFINVHYVVIFLTFIIWFIPIVAFITMDIFQKKKFYDEVIGVLDNLDKKYLLPELIDEPDFVEGRVLYEILKQSNKDMHENIKFYKDKEIEYREYIETWVHEIKTPIASTRLILENNKGPLEQKVSYQIKRVEEFVEQVLFYSRSNDVSKDYIITEFYIDKVINSVIRKNSRDFINKKIKLEKNQIDGVVYSDVKWVEYILNQVVGNSIKYLNKEESKIIVSIRKNENNIILDIEDNGAGISEKDINRVFEKGFTGENGRTFGKSTGMGLYLCKNLCDKLGLGIHIYSKANEGTKVSIIFPIGKNIIEKENK